MRPPTHDLTSILEAGILAPSAENRHFLRFRLRDHSVELLSTDRASWATLPHRRMLALLACGAMIENIALRSAALGYALALELFPCPDADADADIIVELQWRPAAPHADPLDDAIARRHTNRRFYRHGAVEPALLASLGASAVADAASQVRWLDTPADRGRALTAIRIAETERFRRRALHAELFDAVRFDLGWQHACDEGLPPVALEVERPMRRPFAALRHWNAMRVANLFGAHLGMGFRAGYLPCATAPHLGLVLAVDADEAFADIAAGRAFQRLWLAATAAGLALQPMAAATVLARQVAGPDWVSAKTQQRLLRLLGDLAGAGTARPYMLFRLGRAAAPSGVTGRPALAAYIV